MSVQLPDVHARDIPSIPMVSAKPTNKQKQNKEEEEEEERVTGKI